MLSCQRANDSQEINTTKSTIDGTYRLTMQVDTLQLPFEVQLITAADSSVYGSMISQVDSIYFRVPIILERSTPDSLYFNYINRNMSVARNEEGVMQGSALFRDAQRPVKLEKISNEISEDLQATRDFLPLPLGMDAPRWPSPTEDGELYVRQDTEIYLAEEMDGEWFTQMLDYDTSGFSFYSMGLSPDGKRLIAHGDASGEAPEGMGSGDYFMIYLDEKTDVDSIVRLPASVNTDSYEIFPSFTPDGDILVTSWKGYEDIPTAGRGDLYLAQKTDGQYQVQSLGPQVNTPDAEAGAFMDPEGRFILYHKNSQEPRTPDIIMMQERTDDGWLEPVKLSAPVNVNYAFQYAPRISPDGEYLYFNSHLRNDGLVYRIATAEVPELAPFFNE